MGLAIFANSIDVLKKLDIEYDSYCNEFELGRKRIFVKPELLTNEDGSPAFDPSDSVFYSMPDDDNNKEGLLKEVDMSLRTEQHSKAINDDLNYLSLKCGFGTDRYQFGSSGVKTATEIISENSDMYRMIKKHEILLEDAMKQPLMLLITAIHLSPYAIPMKPHLRITPSLHILLFVFWINDFSAGMTDMRFCFLLLLFFCH